MTAPPHGEGQAAEHRDDAGPPGDELPGVVALERVLVRSAEVAVALVSASAYSRGVAVEALLVSDGFSRRA